MDKNQLAEDIKFMRRIVERTHRRIDPGAPIMITWGTICMIGMPGTQWLVNHGMQDWIGRMWIGLSAIGFALTLLFVYQIRKRELAHGVSSVISGQIGLVWNILWPNGVLWTVLGLYTDPYGGPGFLWAALYGIGLSMMGILYSKEWLIAGIAVFISIPIAKFALPYSYTILGVVMGLACIVPGMIALRRMRQWEAEDVAA